MKRVIEILRTPWTHRSLTWRVGTWKQIGLSVGAGWFFGTAYALYLGWAGIANPQVQPWEVGFLLMCVITVGMSLAQSGMSKQSDARAARNTQLLLSFAQRTKMPLPMSLWMILNPVISHRLDLRLYEEDGSAELAEETLRLFYETRGFGGSQCQSGHVPMCIHHHPGFGKWVAGESPVLPVDIEQKLLEDGVLAEALLELSKGFEEKDTGHAPNVGA